MNRSVTMLALLLMFCAACNAPQVTSIRERATQAGGASLASSTAIPTVRPAVPTITRIRPSSTPRPIVSSTPAPTRGPVPTMSPEVTIVFQKEETFLGGPGAVEIELSQVSYFNDGTGYYVKIYQRSEARPLLFETEMDALTSFGFAKTTYVNGQPFILVCWAFGAHDMAAYPILWDGQVFQRVPVFPADEYQREIRGEAFHIMADGSIKGIFRDGMQIWLLSADGYHLSESYWEP